ncbi:PilZ domain-containing protein [Salinarimonas ramus]|uniref:Pilus assembly protein PilZ n=1 Tax=Salinarimonas ramus TaxID=690164 RepID=A0A917Q820_9HYPH|nr:PilZ domain-containing protein [Salinarimonas ramus]GGK34797.1 pilus assembly protein PilZ [Salinarimonas ramus]
MRSDDAYSPFHVDRRRAERLPLALSCRILLGDGSAHAGETFCVSADGAAIRTTAPVLDGEILNVAISDLGLARARVARFVEDGIGVAFERDGRDARVAALIWLEERLEGRRAELRAHPRSLPPPASALVTLLDDPPTSAPAALADVSLGGARLVTELKAGIGAPVRLGSLPARVVRVLPDGFAIAFTRA